MRRYIYASNGGVAWVVLDTSHSPARHLCYVPPAISGETASQTAAHLCELLNRDDQVRQVVDEAAKKQLGGG